jgi:hypothetical protein
MSAPAAGRGKGGKANRQKAKSKELKSQVVELTREQTRERAAESAREQSEMDRIGLAVRGSFARA